MGSIANQTSLGNPTIQQDALDVASQALDKFFSDDMTLPSLPNQLKVSNGESSVSGLNDFDYPNLCHSDIGLDSLKHAVTAKTVPLPSELIEHIGNMHCNCILGLFPEIGRAWLTVDSDIYVWIYEDGGDVAYFDGLNETILSVGLVKPKSKVFQKHIMYLLCLATPVEIVLLGVSFTSTSLNNFKDYEEMHLLPEPLYCIPSDGAYVTTITGTDDGRIFMGAKDGCLYELAYQAQDGWFTKKCRKINHSSSALSYIVPSFINMAFYEEDPLIQISIDNTRNILFTRSEKGCITVFDMGLEGGAMIRVTSVSQSTLVRIATSIARTVESSNFKPIVHIQCLEKTESNYVHLVAVTENGVRLYFTTTSIHNPLGRPNTLHLIHVRLPPGFSANSTPRSPRRVHTSFYRKGTLLLSAGQNESSSTDVLWVITNTLFPIYPYLMETSESISLEAKTWALIEEKPMSGNQRDKAKKNSSDIMPPSMVTQHNDVQRRIIIVTAQGVRILVLPRPVDYLESLLYQSQTHDSEKVKSFFKLVHPDQACAMCLILACSAHHYKSLVVERAVRAFFAHGGDPSFIDQPPQSYPMLTSVSHPGAQAANTSPFSYNMAFQPAQASTPQGAFHQRSPPMSPATSPMLNHAAQNSSNSVKILNNSSKHNGLYLYFARLMRNIWFLRAVDSFTSFAGKKFMISAVETEELSTLIEQLSYLLKFVDSYTDFLSPLTTENSERLKTWNQKSQMTLSPKDAQIQERQSLISLRQLIIYSMQVLGLWKVLCDHQFHIVAETLPQEVRNQLQGMTFRDLIVSGRDVCTAFLNAIINRYIGDNTVVDAISSKLREICPLIYRNEDAICAKANEILSCAKSTVVPEEKDKLLFEALNLCKRVAAHLDLNSVCQHFQVCRFYSGLVDLCLATALQRDPQKIAVHYYNNNQPSEDSVGRQAFLDRQACYKVITNLLRDLLLIGGHTELQHDIPSMAGVQPHESNTMPPSEAIRYVDQILELAMKSDDELFHVALFTWLIDHQLYDVILKLSSPFLEGFLKKTASSSHVLDSMDLLWKHYEKNRNYVASSQILSKLAEKHGTDINLSKRMEYLSRAILCLTSGERSIVTPEGEFLHELEEKMEVTRLQLEIVEALRSLFPETSDVREALMKLDADLFDVMELYNQFASKFNLYECQLSIIHCAGYQDQNLIEELWRNIILNDLNKNPTLSPESRVAIVRNNVTKLGKKYASPDKFFPLEFIAKFLELKSVSEHLDLQRDWVVQMFIEINIPLLKLLSLYDHLYHSESTMFRDLGKPFHLLQVIGAIMNKFLDNPHVVPPIERRQMVSKSLSNITDYLVDLQASVGIDDQGSDLIKEMRGIQARLERY